MFLLSILTAFHCLSCLVHGADLELPVSKKNFLKFPESATGSEISIIQSLFRMNVDARNFDFFGNEISLRPDRILPVDSDICLEIGNTNLNFRKIAGLILPVDEAETVECSEDMWALMIWPFDRVNELKKRFYYPRGTSVGGSADNLNGASPPSFFPLLDDSNERVQRLNEFCVDLVRIVLPNMKGSLLDHTVDAAGIFMFLTVNFTLDLEGYFDQVREFYGILKDLIYGHFEIKGLEEELFVDRSSLLEELFKFAVTNDLSYTLELFYALDMVEFSGDLLQFVVKNSFCPVLLNRFFDFIDWKGVMHVPEIRITTPVSRLHFLYEEFPGYVKMLYEYEGTQIDWSIAEVPGESGSRTILGKILRSLTEQNSAFNEAIDDSNLRQLLRELLVKAEVPRVISRTPVRDLLDECFEKEFIGLKKLNEYFDAVPSRFIDGILAEYLGRIVEIWRFEGGELSHVKLFKYLMKKRAGNDAALLSVLNKAYELIGSLNPCPKTSPRNRGSFRRSLSGEFFRSIFRESSSSSLASSSGGPSPVSFAASRATSEVLRMIAEEGEAMCAGELDLLSVWTGRLADLEERGSLSAID